MGISGKRIHYKTGYKYQLFDDASIQTHIFPEKPIITTYITLTTSGVLTCLKGYAWDGASSFPDFKWIMRGSLFHDALYALIRLELLEAAAKDPADRTLEMCCIEDGSWEWVAASVYKGVSRFGGKAAHPDNKRIVLAAP